MGISMNSRPKKGVNSGQRQPHVKRGPPGGVPGGGVLPRGGKPASYFLGRAGGVEFCRINQSLIRGTPPGGVGGIGG